MVLVPVGDENGIKRGERKTRPAALCVVEVVLLPDLFGQEFADGRYAGLVPPVDKDGAVDKGLDVGAPSRPVRRRGILDQEVDGSVAFPDIEMENIDAEVSRCQLLIC
jgi:hypothetical protein